MGFYRISWWKVVVLASNMAIEWDSDGFLFSVDWLLTLRCHRSMAMGHLRKNIFERGVSQQQVYPEVFRSCVNQPKWRFIIWKHLNQPKLKLCFVILKHFNQKYFQPRKNGGSAWNCPARTGLELFGCHGDLIHSKIGNKWRNRYNNTCNGTMIYIYTYYLNT